jgi:hypothetical protein
MAGEGISGVRAHYYWQGKTFLTSQGYLGMAIEENMDPQAGDAIYLILRPQYRLLSDELELMGLIDSWDLFTYTASWMERPLRHLKTLIKSCCVNQHIQRVTPSSPNGAKTQLLMHTNTNYLLDLYILLRLFNKGY